MIVVEGQGQELDLMIVVEVQYSRSLILRVFTGQSGNKTNNAQARKVR